VPVLVGLDRDILDRPPDRPDDLPTMLRTEDPRDASGDSPKTDVGKAASQALAPDRPQLPSVNKGNPPRRALASDDVP
jgi:hypothetical protein